MLAIVTEGQSPVLNRVSEVTFQRRDGTVRLAQQVIFAIPTEHGYMASTIVRDVTEQKQAEQELSRLKEFNERIIQTMQEGILLEDAGGYIQFINPAGASLLGYAPDELRRRHWTHITPPHYYAVVRQAVERRERGEADHYETEMLCKDGSVVNVRVSASPWVEEGRIVGSASVFSNISDLKRRHQALDHHAQQMACLYETSMEISSLSDTVSLLPAIVKRAAGLLGAPRGALYLLNPDSQSPGAG